ncbi:hypothetical protein [Dinghuibacter silviterrae]|nr:hypothetical protein [Dinghuibacter silviterrae]
MQRIFEMLINYGWIRTITLREHTPEITVLEDDLRKGPIPVRFSFAIFPHLTKDVEMAEAVCIKSKGKYVSQWPYGKTFEVRIDFDDFLVSCVED